MDPNGRDIWSVLDTVDRWAETVLVPISLGGAAVTAGFAVGGAFAIALGFVAGIPLVAAGITVGIIYALDS